MSRKQVTEQLQSATHPARLHMLQAALAELDRQLDQIA